MKLSLSHSWTLESYEDTPITSFTEGVGYDTTPNELNEAEEEIAVDEYSEEELMCMNEYALSHIRFIPRMEYGTPSGIEPVKTCSSCGDAGDVAIIDAELSPTVSPDEDMTEEMSCLREIYTKFERLQYPAPIFIPKIAIAGKEDFSDLIDSLVGALKSVMTKVASYARKAYIFSRDRISKSVMRLSTISKLWNIKLKMNLANIDVERLKKFEIEAFPYDVWVSATKLALTSFDMANNARAIVFDISDDPTTSRMKNFEKELEKNGIIFDVTKNVIDMNTLLDKRSYDSIMSLGFTKSQITNCMRYLGDMSKCVPDAKENVLQKKMDDVVKEISNRAARTNKAVESGQLKKSSDEYKENVEKIMHYTVRLDFALMCMRCAYGLFDLLTTDILKVFGKYEDAYAIKSLVE